MAIITALWGNLAFEFQDWNENWASLWKSNVAPGNLELSKIDLLLNAFLRFND